MAGRITIHLHADGTISADIGGMPAARCADYLPVLERLLQAVTIDSTDKPEYLETNLDDLVGDTGVVRVSRRIERSL